MSGHGRLGLLLIILLALVLAWYWTPTREADPERWLRVGIYENEPKIYRTQGGRPDGFFPRLLQAMAEREAWTLKWVDCQWQQCLDWLQEGQLDLMPDVAGSEARRATLDFHQVPVVQAWSQLYRAADAPLSEMADLAGLRVAVLAGSVQQDYLSAESERLGLDLAVIAFDDMADVMASVAAGLADVAAANHFYGRFHAAEHQLLETPLTFDQVSLYFVAAGGRRDALLATIDQYLLDWKADPGSPYYHALSATIARSEQVLAPAWVRPALIVIAAIFGLLVLLTWLLRQRVHRDSRKLARTSSQLTHLLDSSPVILYSLRGPALQADWVSGNIERILHISPEQALEPGWFARHLHPDDRPLVDAHNRELRAAGDSMVEYRLRDGHGHWRYIRDEKRRIEPGSEVEIIGSWTDLTENHRQEQRLSYLAQHDPQTGLPNRSRLTEFISQALVEWPERAYLVIYFDLDRFRSINEHLGSVVGDQLLRSVGQAVRSAAGPEAMVARVGSDEFGLFVPDTSDEGQRSHWLDGLLEEIRQPRCFEGHTLVVGASVGVARYPEHGDNQGSLLAAAELASQAAARSGGDGWQLYQPGMAERGSERLRLEQELRAALDNKELRLHFQPQFDLVGQRLAGLEALVRWQHPSRGLLGPSEFIDLAEETGLIVQIDLAVLDLACQHWRRWHDEGFEVPRVSVNMSARQFHDESLVEHVAGALSRHGVDGRCLELEITETMLMEFPDRALNVMRRLEALGLRFSMDDFGSGYSNLAYLRRLPLHQLKIDQSLTADLEQSFHSRSIVRAIIAMTRALELELVAEGIEDRYQLDLLRNEGCTIAQGFLLARPGPAEALPGLIENGIAALAR